MQRGRLPLPVSPHDHLNVFKSDQINDFSIKIAFFLFCAHFSFNTPPPHFLLSSSNFDAGADTGHVTWATPCSVEIATMPYPRLEGTKFEISLAYNRPFVILKENHLRNSCGIVIRCMDTCPGRNL